MTSAEKVVHDFEVMLQGKGIHREAEIAVDKRIPEEKEWGRTIVQGN